MDHLPVLRAQTAQCGVQRVLALASEKCNLRIVALDGGRWCTTRHALRGVAAAMAGASPIAGFICGNRKKPRFEWSTDPECTQRVVRLDARLLRRVVGFVAVTNNRERDAVSGGTVPSDELFVCGCVAVLRARNERRLRS